MTTDGYEIGTDLADMDIDHHRAAVRASIARRTAAMSSSP